MEFQYFSYAFNICLFLIYTNVFVSYLFTQSVMLFSLQILNQYTNGHKNTIFVVNIVNIIEKLIFLSVDICQTDSKQDFSKLYFEI